MALDELQNGRYRSVRLLGRGGMGEVYLMLDTRVNRQVAIKVTRTEGTLYPDIDTVADASRLFEREARAIAALDHPNILPLYDFGEENRDGSTITYMVMPYCPEGTLAEWLKQRRNQLLSPQDIAYVVEQAAEGLEYAHEHNVIHLDVKPSNFLLRSNKKNPQRPTLLLADFGIARNFTTVAHSSRTIRGTPTSMAPEQWSSNPVTATDQYALAVMAYELLTGRPPFVGSMEQLMYKHFAAPPPAPSSFNPHIPAGLDAVLLRALSKKPEERYPSITAFAEAFQAAVQGMPENAAQGSDVYTTLAISQDEAKSGISQLITLPGGKQVQVPVPAGTKDGEVIRVPDAGNGTAQDKNVLVSVSVKPGNETPPAPTTDRNTPVILPSQPEIVPQASAHEQPTVATTDTGGKIAGSVSYQALRPKRSPILLFSGIGVASLVIIALLVFGSIYLFSNRQANINPVNANTLNHAQTATAAARRVTPSPTITPTQVPRSNVYVAASYGGSMTDQNNGQRTSITVYIVQTRGFAPLTGSVTFKSPPQGVYTLHGSVDDQGNFWFSIRLPNSSTPLLYQGVVQHQPNGTYLHGNYCSSSTQQCLAITGYFTVGPGY
jgi:serine/threonine protein kinase